MKLTKKQLHKIVGLVLSERLNRKNCFQFSHSLAWISPVGEVSYIKPSYQTHADWAANSFIAARFFKSKPELGWTEGMGGKLSQRMLLDAGWVRVTNGQYFQTFKKLDELPESVISAMLDIMGTCAKIQELNPEMMRLVIDFGQLDLRGKEFDSVFDFLDIYGSEADAEKMYGFDED